MNSASPKDSPTHPEIERKFLLAAPPPATPVRPASLLQQGYLLVDRARQIRLRQSGEGIEASYFLTVKDEKPGSPRMETELALSAEQFAVLWPLTLGQRLEKVRSYHALGNLVAEVDTYLPPHEGLVVVEVEFPDLEASRTFVPPVWFGEEITGHPRYSNLVLAGAVPWRKPDRPA